MKRTIERLTRAAMLTVAFMLCASSAWAATGEKVTLTNGSGGSYATSSFTASDTYTIKIPETGGLVEGDYVRIDLFAYGMGSVNDAFNAKNIKVTDYDGNVISLGSACGIDGWTDVKFGNNSWKQFFGVGDGCVLKVGETYAFQMLNSSGNTTAQKVWAATDSSHTTLATSPVVQSTTDTNNRMTQEVVLTKLSGKPLIASIAANDSPINLTELSWSESLPNDLTLCPSLIITVTGNATLNIDSAITADQVVFRIAQGATLKLTGSQITTVCGVVIGGKGTVDLSEANIVGLIYKDDIIIVDSATDGAKSFMQSTLSYHITARGSESSGVSVSFDNNQRFYTHVAFDGGTHNVTSINNGTNYTLCDNSSNSDPMWSVKNGTVLNITAKDFAGYQGSSKAAKCVVAAEDGATITLKDNGSNTFYASNRWFLYPGSLLNISTASDRFRVIGGSDSGQEQFYVPAGSGEAVIGGTGTINLHAAVGIFVDQGSTLKIANAIKQSNNIVKRGAGTWKQTGSMSTYTGSITIEAGTLSLMNGLDLNASTSLKFSAGTTLAIEETAKGVAGDGTVTLKVTSDSAVPNIVVYEAGTTTPIPGAAISKDDTTLTITYTPVSASGSICWMDFEFNNTTDSSGQLTGSLKSWGKTGYISYYYNNSQLYMDCRSASDNMTTFTFPSEWTAVMRTTAPAHSNDKPMVMLMCGNPSHATYSDAIGIVATKDGKVALATGTGIIGDAVSVDDATTKMHYYVIRKVSDKVELFVDGELEVSSDTSIAPAGVFQIGDVYNGSSVYSDCNVAARVDYLRFYNCALGDNMLAAIRASAPWMSVTLDNVEGTDWSALSWSDDFNPDGNTQITVASASSIEVGSATTIGVLKLVGSADLTIADIGNLTVDEFDLSDYTGNLTLSVDSVTTATAWKFTGSADVTVVSSAQLTLGSLDLSEYSGEMVVDGPTASPVAAEDALYISTSLSLGSSASLTVSHNALVLANGALTGAGTFILDSGTGNAYTMSQSNTGYTGEAVVKSGTVKMGDARSFGPYDATKNKVRVLNGATIDTFGCVADSAEYETRGSLILENGSTYNASANTTNSEKLPFSSISLQGNAKIDSDYSTGLARKYYDPTALSLGDYKLTKVGAGTLYLAATTISGTGELYIQEGVLSVRHGYWYNTGNQCSCDNGTIRIGSGAFLDLDYYQVSAWEVDDALPVLRVNNLILDGTIRKNNTRKSSKIIVSGSISGIGTTPVMILADGATLKPKSSAGGLTVSSSLTLNGTINVDISDVDLTGKSDLAIITGPTQIDKDNDVGTFTLGSNSENWELYSEEVSTGVYVLGVRLSTITDSVSWNGAGGTWSVNSFNGGTENYSNQALQTVTFADDGESTTTPLAVTVSGAKTVNALNFTADNRNVTLSGDAITADTVSKSGDSVATINNELSATTSISVTDGVLVLNPTDAVVADVWTESDNGTLVVYVDSGDTTTISAAITATKLIKRGAGTLVLSASNTISSSIVVSEGTLKASTNVGCFGGETIPVYVEDGAAVDMNNVRFLNRVYIIGDGPDGNGAYINTGDNNGRSGGMQGNIANKLTLTGDASIGGTATIHFASSSSVDVGAYTLTKKGVFWLPLAGTTISGTGKIVIEEGDFSNNSGANDLSKIDLEITGGTLDMAGGTSMAVKNFKSATAITANATTSSSAKLIVNGKIEANGTLTIPNLQLNDGATIELATTASKVAVSGAFTFATGTVTCQFADGVTPGNATFLDLSALNLASAPAGSFVLPLALEEIYVPTKDATGFSIARGVASVRTTSGITHYNAVATARYYAMQAGENLLYFTVLVDGTQSINYFDGIKIKNLGGADISIQNYGGAEFSLESSTSDDGVTTYTRSNAPTSYVWTDAHSDVDMQTYATTPNHNWTVPNNWNIQGGSTASRCPQEGDTVIFDDAVMNNTTVEIAPSVSAVFAEMNVGAVVEFQRSGDSGTVTLSATNGIVLTDENALLTVGPNISLGTAVTTDVDDKVIKWEASDGTTIYSVVDPVAAIVGGDQYGSLDNAAEVAEAGDEITLLADASVGSVGKAITLDIGTYTLTLTTADALDSITSLNGTGTLVLPAGSAPTSALATLLQNANWQGTVVVSSYNGGTSTALPLTSWSNSGSKIKFIGVSGKLNGDYTSALQELILENGTGDYAYGLNIIASAANMVIVNKLSGSGTLKETTGASWQTVIEFKNGADFTGSIEQTSEGGRFYISDIGSGLLSGKGMIAIGSGFSIKIADGNHWTGGNCTAAQDHSKGGVQIQGTVEMLGSATMTAGGDNGVRLHDGATLKFDDIGTAEEPKCLTIGGSSKFAFGSGTVTIEFGGDAALRDSAKLIDWSGASLANPPAGSFKFTGSADTLIDSGTTYLLSSETDGLYLRKAVAVTYTFSPSFAAHYYPSVAAALLADNAVYLCDAPNETVALTAGKTITTQGKDTSNLTVNAASSEYASPIPIVNEAYSLANTTSAPVTYYWTGATDSAWATVANWKVGSAEGPVATRIVGSTDSVVFNDGANVTHAASVTVAGITVNGAVSVGGSYSLETSGAITGSGTLTIADGTGLASVASGVTVAPDVVFSNNAYIGCGTGGDAITFTGNVSLPAGTVKLWNASHSFAGTTTLNGNYSNEGNQILRLATVNVVSNTAISGSIALNGAVNIANGVTFTIPASNVSVGESASFVLAGRSAVLQDNTSGASGKVGTSLDDGARVVVVPGTPTIYKVGYGTIFSVY